jgi:hypothetical protein
MRGRLRGNQQRQEDLVWCGEPVAGTVECLGDGPDELRHDIVAESDLGGQARLAIAWDSTQRPAKGFPHGANQDGISIGWIERPSDYKPGVESRETLAQALGDDALVDAGRQVRGKIHHRREGYIQRSSVAEHVE